MYRGYELLTWESRLVGVAVWNRMLVWINPNLELEAAGDGFDDPWGQESGENKIRGKILDMGQMRAGKASGGGSGHLEQPGWPGGAASGYLRKFHSPSGLLYLHNYSEAEDILQETLIRYLQNVPQVTGPGS